MAGSNGTTATTLRVGAESSAVVGNTPLVALPRLGADLPAFAADSTRYRRVFQNPSVIIYAAAHHPCPGG